VVQFAGVFTPVAKWTHTFVTTSEGLVWKGIDLLQGSLSVELNHGNSNHWAEVKVLGTVGLTTGGQVNRDGIGAVVMFTPHHPMKGGAWQDGDTVMVPVMGGSSLGSQHSLEVELGMGTAPLGRVEVQWPGGVRNRLYNVHPSERVLIPEIPCSFDTAWSSFAAYNACVTTALDELVTQGVLTPPQRGRLHGSAVVAYFH
jgi:hypothetical protein